MPSLSAGRTSPGPNPRAGVVAAVVGLGLTLMRFDTSLNVALPAVSAALNAPLSAMQWTVALYVLVQIALLPLCGALADRAGYRTVYLTGLGIFTLSAIVSASAATLPHLLVARALQGVGAALMLAAGPALIVAALPPDQRGRALGIVGAAQATGQTIGPAIGGLLIDAFGWPAIFAVRIPVGALALLAAWRLPAKGYGRRGTPLDAAGAVTLGLGATAILYGLSRLSEQGPTLEAVAALAAGAGALGAFLHVERRAVAPLLPLRLLRARVFAGANLSWVLTWLAIFGIWLTFPFFMVQALGLPAGGAGLLLAVVALGMTVSPVPFGVWVDRQGPRWPGLVGLASTLAGLYLLSRLDATSGWPLAALALALVGSGVGGLQAASNTLIVRAIGPGELGIAAGVVALGQSLGVVSGVVFASSVFSIRLGAYRATAVDAAAPAAELSALVRAHQDAFLAAILVLSLAVGSYLWATGSRSIRRLRRP